jgi:hypothetical protein
VMSKTTPANSFGNLATASTEVQSWLEMFNIQSLWKFSLN